MTSVTYPSIERKQRHTRRDPCPICGGGDDDRRGKGERCYGFTSGEWCYCTNGHIDHGNAKRNEKANAWVHFLGERASKSGGSQASTYFVYHSGNGTPLLRVERKGQKPDKRYFQQHPTESGWVSGGIPEAQRVLYRLPELVDADPQALVFIAEGEKCVEALRHRGLIATCNAGGAGKWLPQYNEVLRGRQVVILSDNDTEHTTPPFAGQKHAQAVAQALHGIAASVRVVMLPGLPNEGDVYDYFVGGGTKETLLQFVDQAKEWTPDEEASAKEQVYADLLAKYTFSLEDLLLKAFQPTKWAVDGFIPEGLTIFAGKPKVGKSWMLLALALAIAYGSKALGSIQVEQGDVLYLALEDRQKRLQNRARKIGAQRGKSGRFTLATEWPRLGNGGKELLEVWIKQHPEARLIVVDTLAKIKPRTNERQTLYDADYQSIEPLQSLAQRYSIPIVVVTHLRKMDAEDTFDTISGTLGLNGAADTLLVLKKQRGKADAVLCGEGREGEYFEKVVRFDAQSCLWTLQGDTEGYIPTEERRKIIEVLTKAAPKALTAPQIARQIDAESKNVTQLLFKLKAQGQVISPAYGKYTVPSDNSDKTGKTDESKTSVAEEAVSEEEEGDNTADKTFEASGTDENGSLIALTTLIEFNDRDESAEVTEPGRECLIDLQEEMKRRRPSKEPAALEFISGWASQRNWPHVMTPYGTFKNRRDWQRQVPLLSEGQRQALADYLRENG